MAGSSATGSLHEFNRANGFKRSMLMEKGKKMDVADLTEVTDRSKKEFEENIFSQTKSAPISRSAVCQSQTKI